MLHGLCRRAFVQIKLQSIINETTMDKTARTELHRTYLIEALPDPLTRASAHIQLFDNYIANTRIRLRSVRDPESRAWTHIMQQRTHADGAVYRTKLSEIYLNEDEYDRFQVVRGNRDTQEPLLSRIRRTRDLVRRLHGQVVGARTPPASSSKAKTSFAITNRRHSPHTTFRTTLSFSAKTS